MIAPEERRLINLRDDWDAKVKAEKEAAEAAERKRISDIRNEIDAIKGAPLTAATLGAAESSFILETFEGAEIDDRFAEFYGEAVEAKAEAVAKLREIVAAKTEAEALAARIKEEQEAEAVRLAAERERMAAERAELERQRKEISDQQAAIRAEQDRINAEAIRKLDEDRRAAQAQAAADALAALPKAEVVTNHVEQPLEMVDQPAPATVKESLPVAQTMKLGEINARLIGICKVYESDLQSIGFCSVGRDRAAILFNESDFDRIVTAMIFSLVELRDGKKSAA